LHAEKYFQNLVNPNQIWIVINIFPIELAPIGTPIGAKSMEKGDYITNLGD